MSVKILKTKFIKNLRKLPFEEFKRIFAKVPRLCVDLVVRNHHGIVFIKREIEPAKGKWHLPGGGVLFGESLEHAVLRVALEEIGVRVKVQKILGVMEFFGENDLGHGVSIAFLVSPDSEELQGGWQGRELGFFKIIPTPIVEEQAEFLLNKKLLNRL